MRVVHVDPIQFACVHNVSKLPHDVHLGSLVPFQLWSTVGSTLPELTVEQFHQSLDSVTTRQVLGKDIGGVYLAANLAKFNGSTTYFFLNP